MMKNRNYSCLFLLLVLLLLSACQPPTPDTLFTKMSRNTTGIDFRNLLKENENFNIFKYQYFNNGGGLAVGDFNNDGLQDLVFTGNMVKNRLYINKGNFQFDDLTKKSGIAEKEGWCTGVTTADVNNDGWLDLYICRAAFPFKKLRTNLLFINNGDLTFTEKAAEYGLDDLAFSTHSAFFDYDKDGDLDLFVLNHSTVEYSSGSLEIFPLRNKKNPEFTNKLFRNDNGRFTNVTEAAEIYSNVLSFSLGISITDINDDSWPDVLIGNDFNEPDYLFINQKDGTFQDQFASTFDHSSMFSMGSDVADFNNDGRLDVVSLDMLPETNYSQKMHSGADNYDKVALLERKGFLNQYSRNMLQLNNGDGTFSEVSQMAGVSNTNWSWAPLFFDFDNDGYKDLFIANGYPRDHTNMDFLNFTANEVTKINTGKGHVDFDGYMEQMPAILLPNYFYHNNKGLGFNNKTTTWGLDEPVISQSAAYVDLDNDGDLDLVLNNTADYASVYQNNANQLFQNSYLKVQLKGKKGNAFGIGAKVRIYANGKVFFQEQQPVRGFQSSVDPVLNFGLGNIQKIDSLLIQWPTDEWQRLENVAVNQKIELEVSNAQLKSNDLNSEVATWCKETTALELRHEESIFNDFKIQALLPWFLSREGPAIAIADVNNDGREDVFMGNGKGKTGQLLLQQKAGTFQAVQQGLFEKNKNQEAVEALFFDANGDGHQDLYVANGSFEFPKDDPRLQDRLYLNDGNGQLTITENNLPRFPINSTTVKTMDFDGDGDLDLFVGGGYVHGAYPTNYPSYLLVNNGKAIFEKQLLSTETAQNVNAAAWLDLNGDKTPELIVVGEWSPIQVFGNVRGKLVDQTNQYFDALHHGLWNNIEIADFDGDGDTDVVVGNLGTNSQLSAKVEEPLEMYVDDFDGNGSIDPLMCYYVQGESWPFVSRDDLINQLPYLKKKFLYFKDYAAAKIHDLLSPEQLKNAKRLEATTLETSYFENQGGKLVKKALPIEAQIAPIYALETLDVNKDGRLDLVLAGNHLHARVKLGRLDGNHVLVLLGDGKGNFKTADYSQTGLNIRTAVRQIEKIEINNQTHLLFGINNEKVKSYLLEK